MNNDPLFSVLASIHSVSREFREAVEERITPLSLPANHHLLEAMRVAECAYFLYEGFAMAYTFLDGKKQVEWFWASGQIVIPIRSFFHQVPSNEFIQLKTDARLCCISYDAVQELLGRFAEALEIYTSVMVQYYEASRERTRDLQNLTALQRYEKLRSMFPRVEQYVSQEDIASYLGIAPQSFSRIKRKSRMR